MYEKPARISASSSLKRCRAMAKKPPEAASEAPAATSDSAGGSCRRPPSAPRSLNPVSADSLHSRCSSAYIIWPRRILIRLVAKCNTLQRSALPSSVRQHCIPHKSEDSGCVRTSRLSQA